MCNGIRQRDLSNSPQGASGILWITLVIIHARHKREIHSLVEDARLFSLSSVRDEYDTRMVRQNPVVELDTSGVETTKESRSSIEFIIRSYDEYE